MSKSQMPESVTKLPQDQQDAIREVLQKTDLLDDNGMAKISKNSTISPKQKQNLSAAIKPFGVEITEIKENMMSNPFGCAVARIAEAAAIVACASIPGGQIAIAACITAAHELANQACD